MILGINEKKDILKYVNEQLKQKSKTTIVSDVLHQKEFVDFGVVTYSDKTRAVIKVQDGCDRYCSYCIIPFARGRVRSRKPQNVLDEIREIAKKGIKEVVITGIHIASYGKDFENQYRLIDLLEQINEIDGIERIRLGSLEPTLITEDFIQRLSKLNKICEHFHLSLQSGSNETLKRMNRKYTIEEFENVTHILRNAYKNVILTTDIIVGFPGETENEFNKTYKYLEKINFYKMHIFKYSQRKGTKAAIMENQVDSKIKEARSKKLIELSNKKEEKYNSEYIGKEVKVLFEDEHIENGTKYIKGHMKNYIVVKVEKSGDEDISNQIKNVQIINANGPELLGVIK